MMNQDETELKGTAEAGQLERRVMRDGYLLKFENAIGDCWIDTDVEGDPGRTTNIDLATRYPSLRLARQNKAMLEAIYKRKLHVILDCPMGHNAKVSGGGAFPPSA